MATTHKRGWQRQDMRGTTTQHAYNHIIEFLRPEIFHCRKAHNKKKIYVDAVCFVCKKTEFCDVMPPFYVCHEYVVVRCVRAYIPLIFMNVVEILFLE